MKDKKALAVFIIVTLLGLVAPTATTAQSTDKPAGWQFEITPYVWGVGVKADLKVGLLPEQSVDVSFSELLTALQFGLMGSFEARNGRWGFLFDGIYADLGETVPTPYGDVDVGMKMSIFSLAGTYRALEGKAAIDFLGGLRYLHFSASLELTSGSFAGLQASRGQGWVDGFVGTRLQLWLAKWLALVGYADIGAGGSTFTWQGLAGLNLKFSRVLSGKLGYRYLYFDREESDVLFKVGEAGFYLGLGIRF